MQAEAWLEFLILILIQIISSIWQNYQDGSLSYQLIYMSRKSSIITSLLLRYFLLRIFKCGTASTHFGCDTTSIGYKGNQTDGDARFRGQGGTYYRVMKPPDIQSQALSANHCSLPLLFQR